MSSSKHRRHGRHGDRAEPDPGPSAASLGAYIEPETVESPPSVQTGWEDAPYYGTGSLESEFADFGLGSAQNAYPQYPTAEDSYQPASPISDPDTVTAEDWERQRDKQVLQQLCSAVMDESLHSRNGRIGTSQEFVWCLRD